MTAARRLLPAIALAFPLAACDRSGPAYDLPPGIYGEIVDMTTTLGFSPQTVSIKAGVVTPRCRKSRNTSKPFLRGNITSSKSKSKLSALACANPLSPSLADSTA